MGSLTWKQRIPGPGGGGGVIRLFWGLKFSIVGFSGGGKFGKKVFVWVDLSNDFLRTFKTIWGLVVVPTSIPAALVAILRVKNKNKLACFSATVFKARKFGKGFPSG